MKKILLLLVILALFTPVKVFAQGENFWSEVFLPDGTLNPDLIDLGVTTQTPDWMALDLPFGQSLDLTADYHRFQTSTGDIVILPSPATLFFMAMNPVESGLSASYAALGNGFGGLFLFLGSAAEGALDWSRVQADHPEYTRPDQFWEAVLSGKQQAWTYFSGWGFLTNLTRISWGDGTFRSLYLLYLNGNCSALPGGCAGIALPLPQGGDCPDSRVTVRASSQSIQKEAPPFPLVVGQDLIAPRGADVRVEVLVPAVLFTWYEPVYQERRVCRSAQAAKGASCKEGAASSLNDGTWATESFLAECRVHNELLADPVVSLRASATLEGASREWIRGTLGQTHYGAAIHQSDFALLPGYGSWSGGCDGAGNCRAVGEALRVPFADPGTFTLQLEGVTAGTSFRGISITPPRKLNAAFPLQIYLTLPALTR